MHVRIFYWRHVGERVECVVHKDAPDEGLGAAWGRVGRKEVGVWVKLTKLSTFTDYLSCDIHIG